MWFRKKNHSRCFSRRFKQRESENSHLKEFVLKSKKTEETPRDEE